MPAAEVGETDPERTDPGGEVAQDFLAHLERGIPRQHPRGEFSCQVHAPLRDSQGKLHHRQ